MASANTSNPLQVIAQQHNDNKDDKLLDERTKFQEFATTPITVTIASNPPTVMESEHHHHKRPKEKCVTDVRISTFNQHMTTAAHACTLLFVILIIYVCISGEFNFIMWHPLLLSIGWMLLMTEAILSISKDNLFTGTLSKKVRVRLHWIFLTIALVLISAGFTVVFVLKHNNNKEHFDSWHGLFGFIGVVFNVFTCINGIAALYHGDLRHYIKPRLNKLIHIGCGVITVTFGGISLILVVYTKWLGGNIITVILVLALATYPIVWTLTHPTTTCLIQLKNMLKRKE